MKDKVVFFSGLNGLRAIAALAVVISHTTLAFAKFGLNPFLFGKTERGGPKGYLLASYGVTVFFVLSGFLITYLLFLEKSKSKINIKSFYLRRILRIWPLYYLYLILVLFSIFFFNNQIVSFSTLLYYVFFSANIPFVLNLALPHLDHLWSIGVEEQFYLFWPWMIKKIKPHLLNVLLVLVLLQNFIRVALWYFYPNSLWAIFSIVNRFDCMMIGGIGAVLYYNKNNFFLKIIDNKFSQSVALFILILLMLNKFHINAIVDTFLISLVALTIIIGQINIKNRIINLNHAIFDFFGKISFGIYVYHPLIIFYFTMIYKNLTIDGLLKYFIVYGSIIITTILISYFSYHYYETRFIKLKKRFTSVKSSNTKYIES
jgi:peptidoglycan/LPS O-acetylase OafA/YrhL